MSILKNIYKNKFLDEEIYPYRSIIIFGILIHLITAIYSVGYYQVDEHFQILEFTAYKMGLTESKNLAWEYQAQIRPAIQPGIAYLLIKVTNSLGIESPFNQAIFLRMISAIFSLSCMFLLMDAFIKEFHSSLLKKWFVFLSMMIWFIPYVHVRFSSENWTGIAFWTGFALIFIQRTTEQFYTKYYLKYLLIGFLFGLGFLFRFQTGLLIAGIILWMIFIKKVRFSHLMMTISGIGIALLLGTLLDYWFYGEWTFTGWNYFQTNIIQDKVSGFGIQPWWFYLEEIFLKAFPPFSILIIICTIMVWLYFPKHPLT